LSEGPSGYSDLAALSNNNFACLHEGGDKNLAEGIMFTPLTLEDLQPSRE
jgi:hypothetical protein